MLIEIVGPFRKSIASVINNMTERIIDEKITRKKNEHSYINKFTPKYLNSRILIDCE